LQTTVNFNVGGHAHVLSRRSFLKVAGTATAETFLGAKVLALASAQAEPAAPRAANDHIQIALIGAGGQGQGDTKVAVQVPGVRLVAVADCYDGRLEHSKELWGDDIFTTRDYREILARKDIDAVIIGTPDHWHKQASIDAMKAGKDVYCEKPMIHRYADGPEMIETARATNRTPRFPLTRSTFSSGASGRPMAVAWPEISSCTCSAEPISSPGQMAPAERWQPEGYASGRTNETFPT
jgi:hypothetical protein